MILALYAHNADIQYQVNLQRDLVTVQAKLLEQVLQHVSQCNDICKRILSSEQCYSVTVKTTLRYYSDQHVLCIYKDATQLLNFNVLLYMGEFWQN